MFTSAAGYGPRSHSCYESFSLDRSPFACAIASLRAQATIKAVDPLLRQKPSTLFGAGLRAASFHAEARASLSSCLPLRNCGTGKRRKFANVSCRWFTRACTLSSTRWSDQLKGRVEADALPSEEVLGEEDAAI